LTPLNEISDVPPKKYGRNGYKILYGGRGGIKSWSIAQHLLIAGAQHTLRIPLREW
jgi:hypothetical protein